MMGERLKLFVPGRTELIGNHTDHQRGRAVAAAVKMGLYAEAEPSAAPCLRVFSEGFAPIEVDLADLAPRETERGTSAALVRGTAASLARRGLPLRTFTARVRSTLPAGAGLSSSAAFSVLIAQLLCPDAPAETLAKCAQEAENGYFGKPCGLLDQMTVALGGAVYFDFLTGEVQPLRADFSAMGLALCLTDTGGSHADLTDAYAPYPPICAPSRASSAVTCSAVSRSRRRCPPGGNMTGRATFSPKTGAFRVFATRLSAATRRRASH